MRDYRLVRYVLLFIMVTITMMNTAVSFARDSVTIVERPDSEFLILGLEINGFSRSEGIDSYLPDDGAPEDILIPLRALSDALSVSIDVDPASGTAEGFFLIEDRSFRLDIHKGQVISAGEIFEISSDGVEAHTIDIYVKSKLLEKWFDLNIQFEPSTLILNIDADYPFPFQESAERQKNAQKLLTKSRKNDFDPKDAYLLPYGFISKPSLTLQQSLSGSKTKEDNSVQSSTNIQSSFDFLKFGADLNLTYVKDNKDRNEISNARLTFSRSDPTRKLLGPLKAGRIDVGDVDFSSVPLFLGGRRGTGVAVSSEANFGFRFSQQLGRTLIEGDAPVGWDVELYRNGQFIGFQTVESNARFLFEEVQLINGFNRFQIILFGPEGQKRTITQDIFSGPNILPEGVWKYDFAAGRPEADFLPLREDYRSDTRFGAGGELFYGINDFLTVGGSLYSGPKDEEDVTSGAISTAASFAGFNMQLRGLMANDDRTGWQTALRRRFLGINTALTHTEFEGFDPDDEDIKKSTEISFSRRIGKFNLAFIGEKQTLLDEPDKTVLTNILSSQLFGVSFTNEIEKTISDNKQVDDLEGEISVFTDIFETRVRSSLNYDLDSDATDKLRTFRTSAQKKLENGNTVRLGTNYDFPSNIVSLDMRYSHELDPITLDFDLGANNDQNYFAGITVRTSLQPDKKGYKFVSPRTGTLASLGVRAFIDENNNQLFDNGEKLLKNISFESTRSPAAAKTEEDGIAWLYGLAQTPTRIYVDQAQIPSIYIQPAHSGLDLIPRRGTSSIVDYAFTQLGEIDGFIMNDATGEPLSNVPVKLINIATDEEVEVMNSEYDGYYVFSALPLGDYKIIASYGWFTEGHPDTASKIVTLNTDKPTLLDQNLNLPPEGELEGISDKTVEPIDYKGKKIKNIEKNLMKFDPLFNRLSK